MVISESLLYILLIMHYAIGPVVARIHAASMLAIAWDSAAKKRFQVMHNIIRSFDIIS
jgi:hypothetical protein